MVRSSSFSSCFFFVVFSCVCFYYSVYCRPFMLFLVLLLLLVLFLVLVLFLCCISNIWLCDWLWCFLNMQSPKKSQSKIFPYTVRTLDTGKTLFIIQERERLRYQLCSLCVCVWLLFFLFCSTSYVLNIHSIHTILYMMVVLKLK